MGCRSLTVCLNTSYLQPGPNSNIEFNYFIKDHLDYWLDKMIFNAYTTWYFRNNDMSYIYRYERIIDRMTIYFDTDSEYDAFCKWIKENNIDKDISNKSNKQLTRDTLETINGSFKQDNINIPKKELLKRVVKQYISSKIYKQYYINWKTQNK